jgi:biotin carboxyl carrier protein
MNIKNFLHKRKVWAVVLLIGAAAIGICQAAAIRPQTSSLSGQVTSTISVGASVSEGTVLVTVKSLAGNAPAARANCGGKVVSVKVKPGSQISAGQVVAEIEEH